MRFSKEIETSQGTITVRALKMKERKAITDLPPEDGYAYVFSVMAPGVDADEILVPEYLEIVKAAFDLTHGTEELEKNLQPGGGQ